MTDAVQLVHSYFPHDWNFIPSHPEKDLLWYTDILKYHNSVDISPLFDQKDSSRIFSHKLYINNIVSLDSWGHPANLKTLPGYELLYNYDDYQDAWHKVLLH